MKKHTKIYLDHFSYDESDFIPCEICKSKSVDIHHLEAKGMGGSKTKDYIENLIALCRDCHNHAHSSKEINNSYKLIHMKYLVNNESR